MLPDFNRLKVFYYIYRYGSVMKAAQQLHVTQSAVSQSLLKLEEELQQPLFTRLHKKLVATPKAESLYKLILPFVNALEEEIEQIRHSKSVPCGELRIGAPEEFGERYLILICSAFRQKNPDVSFTIETGHPNRLLPLVGNGNLDFAFADIFSKKGQFLKEFISFDIREVFREKLILVCSDQYFKRRLQSETSFEALISSEFVCYQKQAPEIKNWFLHHFGKTTVPIKNALTLESVRGVISGIKNRMGLGIVPSHLIQEELKNGELVHIKITPDDLINSISLVRLQDKIESLTEKLFISFFMKEIDRLTTRI
ncbi:LysR family transcriptional regulator [bacterium]|nr:LysR family transcriptional regulator [bacterium]